MNDEPEIVELPGFGTGTVVERIDMKEVKPLFDPNHEHFYVRDPDDETDDFYAEICSVEKCGIGRLVARR